MHQRSFTAYLRGGSAQISQFGATAGSHLDGQVASHIGGSARLAQNEPITQRQEKRHPPRDTGAQVPFAMASEDALPRCWREIPGGGYRALSPARKTACTLVIDPMSATGSPRTTSMSASAPAAIRPFDSPSPMALAAMVVAARRACRGVIPICSTSARSA
jgi:hypothetical protein